MKKSLRNKGTFLVLLTLLIGLSLSTQSVTNANAADGTAGSVEVMTSTLVDGQTVTLRCYDLTASGDYTLDFSAGSASQHNFTSPADGGDYYHTIIINVPTAGGACLITLESQSDGVALATYYVNFVSITTLVPTALLIGLAIALMVIGIMVGIAGSVVNKRRA